MYRTRSLRGKATLTLACVLSPLLAHAGSVHHYDDRLFEPLEPVQLYISQVTPTQTGHNAGLGPVGYKHALATYAECAGPGCANLAAPTAKKDVNARDEARPAETSLVAMVWLFGSCLLALGMITKRRGISRQD